MGSILKENILKEKYFLISRIVIMLLLGIYGVVVIEIKTGVSAEILLLISLYISVICLKEFANGKKKLIFLAVATAAYAALIYLGGIGFSLFGAYLYYEFLICFKVTRFWYYLI